MRYSCDDIYAKYLLYESKEAYYLQNTQEIVRIQRHDRDLILGKVSQPQGMKSKAVHGIIGFIKFSKGYYMILITNILPVAILGQHYIYHIQDTQVISLSLTESDYDESRYLQIFNDINLNKHFYFSYTYNMSYSLQYNISNAKDTGYFPPTTNQWNDLFVWNQYLLKQVNGLSNSFYTKIIYGFVDSSKIDIFGKSISIILIGRRSKKFAGTRFLKRGITNEGDVANEVETEQIVIDSSHCVSSPIPPTLTSFVMHRGSIPLFWTQENLFAPKPDIKMIKIDPFYRASCKHVENLFKRYGKPIIVWNLVKSKERSPRESYLSDEFESFIKFINDLLSKKDFIRFIHFDLSRANKSGQDVISILEAMAERSIEETNYFLFENNQIIKSQSGIIRVSCIDCLDRTNAAQFFIGKTVLGYQLQHLKVLLKPYIHFDNAVFKILSEMFKDLGDIIALQYGGSQLVNTVDTYRRTSDWQTHSRDLVESIKRYYNNSFTDVDKQNSINLFLGHFQPYKQSRHIWEMSSDKSLHTATLDAQLYKSSSFIIQDEIADKLLHFNRQKQFEAFYKTNKFTSFEKHFLFHQVSTDKLNRLPRQVSPFEIIEGNSSNLFVKGQLALPINNEKEWKFYKSNWSKPLEHQQQELPLENTIESNKIPSITTAAADVAIYSNYCLLPNKLGNEMLPSTPALASLDPNINHKEFGFYKLWSDYSRGDYKAEVNDSEVFERYLSVGTKLDFIGSINVDEERGELPGWTRHYKYGQYLKTKKYPRHKK